MLNQNFDQLAWSYLLGSLQDQSTLGDKLIQSGGVVVFSLLRAGLRVVHDFNPLRTPRSTPIDRETAESGWVYQIAEPMLESIHAIVSAIGQSAYDALCRALWEQDERLKVLAALVLLQEKQYTSRTVKQVHDAFNSISLNDRNKKYFIESGIFIILSNILAQGGDPKHQQVLQQQSANYQKGVERIFEISRNTGLLYLLRQT